ncbi:MAG: G5 domain-containing protein [Oscillospiraceae bacterium]|nr:G5 domain-containing protein [Oscillospiraceae bacterium]
MQAIKAFFAEKKKLPIYIAAIVLPLLILLAILAAGVFQKTTYVITDGDRSQVVTVLVKSPRFALSKAGVVLGSEDRYTTQPGDGIWKITLQRNQEVTVNYCGDLISTGSYGEPVGDLLNRLDIPCDGNFIVSLPLDTETYDGMEIKVDCVVQMQQTYTEEIPFKTIVCDDPTLAVGQEQVLTEGTNGQMVKTADVVYVNYLQTSHEVTSEYVAVQQQDRIILRGTGEKEDPQSQKPAIGDGVLVTAAGEILTFDRVEQFRATAYSHNDPGCNMITATGTTVRIGTVAVDPKVIPYGTQMFIVSNDGKYVYGVATAEDCGGGIKGDRLDLYFPSREACFQFGRRNCTVYFLS